MAPEGPTICLTMIVRDEAPVIERCLASVAPLIDAWVVVDTGSTDGTQGIVRRALADIPGELIERPWVNFGHNRTEALAYARNRADYALVIDADEVLEVSPEFARSSLTADSLTIETRFGSLTYFRKHLFRNALEWRYEGVLHEHAVCQDAEEREERITGLRVVPRHDGARARDPLTYRRDALALENALAVVKEAGGGPEHIGRLTLYVVDKHDYLGRVKDIGAIYRRLMGKHYPAMALVQVAALLEDRALVEIEATAVL